MASLEGWGSAIELHPRSVINEIRVSKFHPFTESGRQDSNLRSSAPKADALATTLRPGRSAGPNVSPMSVGHTAVRTNPLRRRDVRRFGRPDLAP